MPAAYPGLHPVSAAAEGSLKHGPRHWRERNLADLDSPPIIALLCLVVVTLLGGPGSRRGVI